VPNKPNYFVERSNHPDRKDRTGERRQMNNGLWATVVKYNGYNKHATLLFDNGVKSEAFYRCFKKGQVFCPMIREYYNNGKSVRLTHPVTGFTFRMDSDRVDEVIGERLWNPDKDGYVTGFYNKKPMSRLHRILLGVPLGVDVDHIDGDVSNNELSNLRPCNNRLNQQNVGLSIKNTTGFRGIHKYKSGRKKPWGANIATNSGKIFLGCYETKELAAYAYKVGTIKYHPYARPFAIPNENLISSLFHGCLNQIGRSNYINLDVDCASKIVISGGVEQIKINHTFAPDVIDNIFK